MRLVNWTEFAAMPSGTIFSFYEPCVFHSFASKGETIEGCVDFFFTDMMPSQIFGPGGEVECCTMERWGGHDSSQVFCVYELEDVGDVMRVLGESHRDKCP